jgi:hypothetical protein
MRDRMRGRKTKKRGRKNEREAEKRGSVNFSKDDVLFLSRKCYWYEDILEISRDCNTKSEIVPRLPALDLVFKQSKKQEKARSRR